MTLGSYSEPASNGVPSARKVTIILANVTRFSSEESSEMSDIPSGLSWGRSGSIPQDIVVTLPVFFIAGREAFSRKNGAFTSAKITL